MSGVCCNGAWKPEVGFAWHACFLFWMAGGGQLEKKQACTARFWMAFKTFLDGFAEQAGMPCGEKKCFFSQIKNYSAEIESYFWLWKYKNELVVWNRVNVSGEKICGIHLKRTFLCRKNGMVIAFCYQDYSKHIIFLFGAINRISVFRLIFRWNKSLSLNKRATGIRYALNIKFIYRWMEIRTKTE